MKEFQVKNINNIEAQVTNRGGGNEFAVKQISDPAVMQKCSAAFVEVKPGDFAYGYHYHETVEEIFYIISGEGTLRSIKGDIPVKAGDAISFPTGEGGVHVLRNTSATEKLVYLDFGTRGECEIAHLPDTKQIMVISKEVFGIFDKPEK